MAQQSSIIGMKFSQGDFEPQNFRNANYLVKLVNVFFLTFLGALFIVPLEVLDNLSKFCKLPGLIFGGVKGAERVGNVFNHLKYQFTGLNAYQSNSLEQQRKVTALLFENLPYTLLVIAIKFEVLDCKELSDGSSSLTINIALTSTLFQVFLTVMMTYIESRWLKETTLSYLMTKMTANNNWIPFVHLFAQRQCKININYGDLSIKLPFLSHVFGVQKLTQYEFSDSTLSYLLNELKLWSSEVRGQQDRQRYHLIFTKDCLNQVSLNTFIHFVQNFPEDLFILDVQLDWHEFYHSKEASKLIQFTVEEGEKRTYSPTGLPLIQLCI